MIPALDLDFVRSRFPALASGWAFLDNAGGSQALGAVIERVGEYLTDSMVAHGAPNAVSRLAEERLRAAAGRFAVLLNAGDPREVVMGPSATQLLQNLGWAMATSLRGGDEIVVSEAEHHANVEPWNRLAEARGVIVKRWPVRRESWRLELDDLERLMTSRTRLVAATHCSNVLGSVLDAAALARFVHDRGALVLLDGVASAPHRAIDVQAWGVDYYVMSVYKVFGPHHAVLWGKREHLLGLRPVNHSFLAADLLPYKLQPGNANPELSHASTAVVDYLEALGEHCGAAADATPRAKVERAYQAIGEHEHVLTRRLLDFAAAHPRIRVLGPAHADAQARAAIVSVLIEGRRAQEVAAALAPDRIALRGGDFYARGLSAVLGLQQAGGALRVSVAHYNTVDEIERTVTALERAIG